MLLGKVPGGAPFSQLHKGDGKIARTGHIMQIYNKKIQTNCGSNKFLIAGLPVPIADAESPVRCRYVYGYGVDGSDRATCSGPVGDRMGTSGSWTPRSGEFFDPAKATFIAQLGLKHFFDAFALEHKRDIRVDAAVRAMTAPTVVQDCILFAHNSKDLTREGSNKQNTQTQNNTKKHPKTKKPTPKNMRSTQVKG